MPSNDAVIGPAKPVATTAPSAGALTVGVGSALAMPAVETVRAAASRATRTAVVLRKGTLPRVCGCGWTLGSIGAARGRMPKVARLDGPRPAAPAPGPRP